MRLPKSTVQYGRHDGAWLAAGDFAQSNAMAAQLLASA
jgi:hypothetical protein